jgi:hypothetical protein
MTHVQDSRTPGHTNEIIKKEISAQLPNFIVRLSRIIKDTKNTDIKPLLKSIHSDLESLFNKICCEPRESDSKSAIEPRQAWDEQNPTNKSLFGKNLIPFIQEARAQLLDQACCYPFILSKKLSLLNDIHYFLITLNVQPTNDAATAATAVSSPITPVHRL